MKWEKLVSLTPQAGVAAVYSPRITQSRQATAYRDGNFIRLLTISPDHDATYGKNSHPKPPLSHPQRTPINIQHRLLLLHLGGFLLADAN